MKKTQSKIFMYTGSSYQNRSTSIMCTGTRNQNRWTTIYRSSDVKNCNLKESSRFCDEFYSVSKITKVLRKNVTELNC